MHIDMICQYKNMNMDHLSLKCVRKTQNTVHMIFQKFIVRKKKQRFADDEYQF